MPRQRNTKQRMAIEEVFQDVPRPLSPAEVLELAQKEVPGLGIATVYRALNDLVAEEKLRVVELPGQTARYEKSGLAHHHHFHCTECDKVFDLDGCFLKPELELPAGFKLLGHDITLKGTCPHCGRENDGVQAGN